MKQGIDPSCGAPNEEESWKQRLYRCILDSTEKYRCDYLDRAVISKIFENFETSGRYQELWFETLFRVWGRVRDDRGVQYTAVKKKKRVYLPIGRTQKNMVMFYENQPKERRLVFDFLIRPPQN